MNLIFLLIFLAKNCIVLNIDGIRNNECFEAQNLYTKFIWDSLRPKGTIYTNFYVTGITYTTASHSVIINSSHEILLLNIYTPQIQKQFFPGIGEYLIKYLNLPQNKVYYISGKNTIWKYPISLLPGFGESYSPKIVLTQSSQDDIEVYDSLVNIMNRDHPRFIYAVFPEIDEMGHHGGWNGYINAIRKADSLCFEVYKKIQDDPFYKDSTLFIITTDHGRHDYSYQGHGDFCHGCRHIPFLAIGPDIKVDTAVDLRRDYLDIAPTIAYLMGLDIPNFYGEVMSEMIEGFKERENLPIFYQDEMNISNSSGRSSFPDIFVNEAGIHVVFSDNTDGFYQIYYTKSQDFGNSFTEPIVLFQGNLDKEYLYPSISGYGDSLIYVVASEICDTIYTNEKTYVWKIKGKKSKDGGNTWSNEVFILNAGEITHRPAIKIFENKINCVSMDYYGQFNPRIVRNLSIDTGNTFLPPELVGMDIYKYSYSPSITYINGSLYCVWQEMVANHWEHSFWNIWIDKEPCGNNYKKITNNNENIYSYFPSIESDPYGNLHLVYSNLDASMPGNFWQIFYRKSNDYGNTWTEPVNLISYPFSGIYPSIKYLGDGILLCIWANYNSYEDKWCIGGVFSNDTGNTWSPFFQISSYQNFSLFPRIAVKDNYMYTVFEDSRSGNFDIYFKKFYFTQIYEMANKISPLFLKSSVFKDNIELKFSLPYSGYLKIYDITGKEVERLSLNNSKRITLKIKSSGKYFIRLEGIQKGIGVLLIK
ncbi:MAG: alkaline phosphatase family protein [candidate division WOR-3 bacterium]